jgi:hypothetical protein
MEGNYNNVVKLSTPRQDRGVRLAYMPISILPQCRNLTGGRREIAVIMRYL